MQNLLRADLPMYAWVEAPKEFHPPPPSFARSLARVSSAVRPVQFFLCSESCWGKFISFQSQFSIFFCHFPLFFLTYKLHIFEVINVSKCPISCFQPHFFLSSTLKMHFSLFFRCLSFDVSFFPRRLLATPFVRLPKRGGWVVLRAHPPTWTGAPHSVAKGIGRCTCLACRPALPRTSPAPVRSGPPPCTSPGHLC